MKKSFSQLYAIGVHAERTCATIFLLSCPRLSKLCCKSPSISLMHRVSMRIQTSPCNHTYPLSAIALPRRLYRSPTPDDMPAAVVDTELCDGDDDLTEPVSAEGRSGLLAG